MESCGVVARGRRRDETSPRRFSFLGALWPATYALEQLTAAEAEIGVRVGKAVG